MLNNLTLQFCQLLFGRVLNSRVLMKAFFKCIIFHNVVYFSTIFNTKWEEYFPDFEASVRQGYLGTALSFTRNSCLIFYSKDLRLLSLEKDRKNCPCLLVYNLPTLNILSIIYDTRIRTYSIFRLVSVFSVTICWAPKYHYGCRNTHTSEL